MTERTIGIDISKTHLGAFRLEDEVAARFENSPSGLRELIKWLGGKPVVRVTFEVGDDRAVRAVVALASGGEIIECRPHFQQPGDLGIEIGYVLEGGKHEEVWGVHAAAA